MEVAIRGTIGPLDKTPNNLSPEEWSTIKDLRQVLSPFEEAIKAISGEQYMTASLTIVIVQGLKNVCEQLKKCNYTPRTINLVSGINDRQGWGNIENSNTLSKRAFLDPRFKNVPFANNSGMLNSTSHLISLPRSEVSRTSNEEHSTSAEITSRPNEKTFSIWETINTQVTRMQPSERTSTARAIIEVQRDMEEMLVPRNRSHLIWWQGQKHN